tara:strand:- start:963 stop:1232 length:270 start_codon:yes stop_codon:yes gene_type:complete
MKVIVICFMLLVALGCTTTVEILPSVCFNEKDGTYICEEPTRKYKQPQPEEIFQPKGNCKDRTYHGHCVEDIWLEDPVREKFSKYKNVA